MSIVCDGPDGVRVAARTAFRRGATQLKVMISGGVVSLTDRIEDSQFTVQELRAAVQEARACFLDRRGVGRVWHAAR